jgi:hypothetical protein
MRRFGIILLVSAFTNSCVLAERASNRQISLSIDSMCEWALLKRAGAPTSVRLFAIGRATFYNVRVPLSADGIRRDYAVILRDDLTVESYMLKEWPFPSEYPEAGTVADTIKDKGLRQRLLTAVKRVNVHLNRRCVEPAQIQRAGSAFVVTYRQMTKREQAQIEKRDRGFILHPYVSFLVTSHGAVLGTWWGTVP